MILDWHSSLFTLILATLCLAMTSCASTPDAQTGGQSAEASAPKPIATVPLNAELQVQHFYTLPVRVSGVQTLAILDTGIGLALISKALCERLGCAIDGSFTGHRMSGQAVTIPLTRIDRLELGGVVQNQVIAGVIDIEGFFPDPRIEAFVGLPFFEQTPFTIDAAQRALILESPASLAERVARGRALELQLKHEGPALDVFAPVCLANGTELSVLVDTGSFGVTLHTRYAETLGIDLDSERVTRRVGEDETQHRYTRYFTELEALAFATRPPEQQTRLKAMFQEIIYDGLVGTEFLERFVLSYDLAQRRLILGPRRP